MIITATLYESPQDAWLPFRLERGYVAHHSAPDASTGEIRHVLIAYDWRTGICARDRRVYSTFPSVRIYHRERDNTLFNWTVAMLFLAGALAMIFLTARY